jgi:hypothetical protein
MCCDQLTTDEDEEVVMHASSLRESPSAKTLLGNVPLPFSKILRSGACIQR